MIERIAVGALVLPMSVLEIAGLPETLGVLAVAWAAMRALDYFGERYAPEVFDKPAPVFIAKLVRVERPPKRKPKPSGH